MDAPLYSARAGRERQLSPYDFRTLVWRSVFSPVRRLGLFEERLPGGFGDIDAYLLDKLNTSEISSMDLLSDTPTFFTSPDQDLLFDLLELLHRENVSAPGSITRNNQGERRINGPFDRAEGQRIFRGLLNPVLARHAPPLEMLPNGHIIELPAPAIHALIDEPIPDSVEPALREPIEAAIERFYRRGATGTDRGDALRHLASFLEHQRQTIKTELLSKDENALFEVANGFSIRHHNRGQQDDYDKGIWQEWIFHVYLATAKALVQVAQRDQAAEAD
jgi:hypothetical protein